MVSSPWPISFQLSMLKAAHCKSSEVQAEGLYFWPWRAHLSCVQGEPAGLTSSCPGEEASSNARWRLGGEHLRSLSLGWET